MPWSPFSHVPKKTGREGTPESEPTNSTRKKKRPSYLQEFDIIAEGLDDNSPTVKGKESEKEKKAKMPSIQEKPEAKVKEKSSYKKLISNLQTTYPDLSQEEALKGILALRVQNNGTLTGMTMLEIMERVIQFARPEKGKQKEEPEPVKEPVAIEETQKTSESKKKNSKPEKEEAEFPTNGEDAMISPSKTAQVEIAQLDSPKSPKTVKPYSKKSNQKVESEDETVPITVETPSKKGKTKNELPKEDMKPLDESADDEEVEETPKKRRQNLDTLKRASSGRVKARESSLESLDDLLRSEKSEESDASIETEPSKKSPVRKKKTSPKKKADKEEKTLSDSEKEENVDEDDEEYKTPKKSERKKKEKVQTPRTTSKPRGRKKEIEEAMEEEKAEESDASFKPDSPKKSHKKKSSPKKKEETAEEDSDGDVSFKPDPPKKSHKKKPSPKTKEEPAEEDSEGEVEVQVSKRSPQKSKKKEETIKAMEVTEEEQPRTSRKRKVPSYLKEFAVEETKASQEPEKEDEDPVPETPKQTPSKRRKIEADPEPEAEPETPKRKKGDVEPKTPKRKKGDSDAATPKSRQKKKSVPSTTAHGECVLCGLMFDEESTKFCMTDKTRETGQTFADILFGLFHEESLPPSLAEKAKAVDLDGGSLCTLCVSHVDQLDVFQQKVTDIKTSIISIFIQKTRNDSLNQGEIESGDSEPEEEATVVAKVTPKKKGKKGKGKAGKLVTLVYQSPLKKVRDLEAMSEKEILKMTETVIKYTPKKMPKKVKAVEDDQEEEDIEETEEVAPVKKIESKPDPDLAMKLSALSGIEIKRVNTETGDESLQISGLAGIEIKKIDDSSSEKKTPSKKKTPKKEKTPGKTPGKRGRPKKSEAIEVAGEPVFEEACEELQNDLGADAVNGEENPINSSEEQADTPAEMVGPPPVGNVARGAMMPNIPVRGGPIRMSPGRGGRGARGGPRGGIGRGMGRGMLRPPGMNFRPTPPKSKKSLFEISQNKRMMGSLISNNGISISPRTPAQNTPVVQNYRVNGIQATSTPIMAATVQTLHVPVTPLPLPVSIPVTLTPSKLNGLHGISITSSVTMSPLKEVDIQAPAEVKEKKAYKKLISKIQAVHPDMSHEEAMRGIVALRASNNGTLTGMSMQEIITKVRENVRGESKFPMETETENQAINSPAPPVGELFEKIVNDALTPAPPAPQSEIFLTPTKTVDPATLYEIKCKFCSRLFKSSSETATKKVYEIHIQEHEKETRSIFDKQAPETELTVAAPDAIPTPTNNTEHHEEPDLVKSEKSYCKLCQKQFKSAKLYGLHQNTEHAAEIEFEKIMNSP